MKLMRHSFLGFLTAKCDLVDTQELTQLTFDDDESSREPLVAHVEQSRLVCGRRTGDSERLRESLAKNRRLIAVSNLAPRESGRRRKLLTELDAADWSAQQILLGTLRGAFDFGTVNHLAGAIGLACW